MKKGLAFMEVIILSISLIGAAFLAYLFVKISKFVGKSSSVDIELVSSNAKFVSSFSVMVGSSLHKLALSSKNTVHSDYVEYISLESPSWFFRSSAGKMVYLTDSPYGFLHSVRSLIGRKWATTGNVLYNSLGIYPSVYYLNSSGSYLLSIGVWKGGEHITDGAVFRDALDYIFLGRWHGSCDDKSIYECGSSMFSCFSKVKDICYVPKKARPHSLFIPVISGKEAFLLEVGQ